MPKSSILHELIINAPSNKVYKAITTLKGLKSWWTKDTVVKNKIIEFGFYNRSTLFRMKIIKLQKNKKVVWNCIGDEKEWKGTKITFKLLKDPESKGTNLKFSHEGWLSTKGWFGLCNYTWAHVLTRLKKYAEKGKPMSYFKY